MPKAVLKISVPEEMWIAKLSREHAIEELRILSTIPSGATGVAVAELTASKPESIVEEIRSIESVVTADVLEVEENRTLLQLETRLPLLLNAAGESGVPVAMPFIVRDGEVMWEVTASRDRLSELGQQLEAPEPYELGWNDVVSVHPCEVVHVAVHFGEHDGQFTDQTGEYMWHCHMIEHEDHDMMRPFEVLPGDESDESEDGSGGESESIGSVL